MNVCGYFTWFDPTTYTSGRKVLIRLLPTYTNNQRHLAKACERETKLRFMLVLSFVVFVWVIMVVVGVFVVIWLK